MGWVITHDYNAKKSLILSVMVGGVIAASGLYWFLQFNSQQTESSLYPDNLVNRGHFEIASDNAMVTLGNKSTTQSFEAEVNFDSNNQGGISLNFDLDREVDPVVENNLIRWKQGDYEVFFKQIPKGTQPGSTIPTVKDDGKMRYIPFGQTSLDQFAASYELFTKRQSTTPAITSFVSNEDGYGYMFYGGRTAQTDFFNIELVGESGGASPTPVMNQRLGGGNWWLDGARQFLHLD